STLSGNSAANSGGGIYNSGGTLTVSNSTLSGNSAAVGGGGISNFGTLTLSNSTLSGNSAANSGGGIDSGFGVFGAPLPVSNCPRSGNSASFGGGVYNLGQLTLCNSLVVNSPSGGDVDSITFTDSNNLTGPLALGPLQNNGGPTPTHALPAGSPAIN